MRRAVLLLPLVMAAVACSNPGAAPFGTAEATAPSQTITAVSTSFDLAWCGTLPADSCAVAVEVALAMLPTTHAPIVTVRVQVPSALATCPPMAVGPMGTRMCDAMVTFTTSDGEIVVPLVRGGPDGWYPSWLVR